ncbi:hypothetical protein ACFJI0_02470 [Hydrogenophaga sp. UC242_53]|uniref:hypothetical protein n=1 Tax=Hydrogenophaga sp. UC242_53 TaxID=3350170 RepID=UPI0036D3139A
MNTAGAASFHHAQSRQKNTPAHAGEGRLKAQHARDIAAVGDESAVAIQARVHPAPEQHQQTETEVAPDHQESPVARFLQRVFLQQQQSRAQRCRPVFQAQPDRAR